MLKLGLFAGVSLAVVAIAPLVPWTDPGAKAEEIAFAVACACVKELQSGTPPDNVADAVYQKAVTKGFRKANGRSIQILLKPITESAEGSKFVATTHLTYKTDQSMVEHIAGTAPPLQVKIVTVGEEDLETCPPG